MKLTNPFFDTPYMTYDQQILQILLRVGERGISVQSLAKHVFNQSNSLFAASNLQDIHQYVQQYLLKNSKSAQSLIESTGRRGFYRLNTGHSADARQMMLHFREEQEEKEEKPLQQDFSLSLFDANDCL